MANPIVTIEMQDGGVIRAELYPETRSLRSFIRISRPSPSATSST